MIGIAILSAVISLSPHTRDNIMCKIDCKCDSVEYLETGIKCEPCKKRMRIRNVVIISCIAWAVLVIVCLIGLYLNLIAFAPILVILLFSGFSAIVWTIIFAISNYIEHGD